MTRFKKSSPHHKEMPKSGNRRSATRGTNACPRRPSRTALFGVYNVSTGDTCERATAVALFFQHSENLQAHSAVTQAVDCSAGHDGAWTTRAVAKAHLKVVSLYDFSLLFCRDDLCRRGRRYGHGRQPVPLRPLGRPRPRSRNHGSGPSPETRGTGRVGRSSLRTPSQRRGTPLRLTDGWVHV